MAKFLVFSALIALIFNGHVSTSLYIFDPLNVSSVPVPRIDYCSSLVNGMVECLAFLSNEEPLVDEGCCSNFESAMSNDYVDCFCEMMKLEKHKSSPALRMLPTICRVPRPCDDDVEKTTSAPSPGYRRLLPQGESPASSPLVSSPEAQSPTPNPLATSPKHQSPAPSPSVLTSSASIVAQSHHHLLLVLSISILFVYFY